MVSYLVCLTTQDSSFIFFASLCIYTAYYTYLFYDIYILHNLFHLFKTAFWQKQFYSNILFCRISTSKQIEINLSKSSPNCTLGDICVNIPPLILTNNAFILTYSTNTKKDAACAYSTGQTLGLLCVKWLYELIKLLYPYLPENKIHPSQSHNQNNLPRVWQKMF